MKTWSASDNKSAWVALTTMVYHFSPVTTARATDAMTENARAATRKLGRSEDVAREILVRDERAESLADVRLRDRNRLHADVGRVVEQIVEQALEHRVQAARTDVVRA